MNSTVRQDGRSNPFRSIITFPSPPINQNIDGFQCDDPMMSRLYTLSVSLWFLICIIYANMMHHNHHK